MFKFCLISFSIGMVLGSLTVATIEHYHYKGYQKVYDTNIGGIVMRNGDIYQLIKFEE
jgi:hypothetical protein